MAQSAVSYPYMPTEGTIEYVPESDAFIREAKAYAAEHSLDKTMPNASVVVLDGKIIGRGANGSTYHETNVCERVRLNIPTGRGYELCEGCHPKNHSEPKAVADALKSTQSLKKAELYLWGHWWCCQPCWDTMLNSGLRVVRLLKDSDVLFDRSKPGNIVGKQFANAT